MIFLDTENSRSTIVFREKLPIAAIIKILLQDTVRYSLHTHVI